MYYLVPFFMLLAFFAGVSIIKRGGYSMYSLVIHTIYFTGLAAALVWFIFHDIGKL